MLTLIFSEVVRGDLRRMWKSDGGKRNSDLERRCMVMERKLQLYNTSLPPAIAIKETSHVGDRTQNRLTRGLNDLGRIFVVPCTCVI